jgi:hypothetical protein
MMGAAERRRERGRWAQAVARARGLPVHPDT